MKFRVLTYNLHKGFCFYSRQYVLEALREAVREVNADVVFVQEVMGVHPPKALARMVLESQFEYLADEIWPHFAYGKNAVYSDGHHGNAILSKFPISCYENINVSTNPIEKRGLLHAQLPVEGREHPVHVVCLHLDLFDRGRRQQMQKLIAHVERTIPEGAPLIIAGDFNDWLLRFSSPLREALNLREASMIFSGAHAPTFPSWRPLLALDRVYLRGFHVHNYCVLSGAPWRHMSDHAAVMVELEVDYSGELSGKPVG